MVIIEGFIRFFILIIFDYFCSNERLKLIFDRIPHKMTTRNEKRKAAAFVAEKNVDSRSGDVMQVESVELGDQNVFPQLWCSFLRSTAYKV